MSSKLSPPSLAAPLVAFLLLIALPGSTAHATENPGFLFWPSSVGEIAAWLCPGWPHLSGLDPTGRLAPRSAAPARQAPRRGSAGALIGDAATSTSSGNGGTSAGGAGGTSGGAGGTAAGGSASGGQGPDSNPSLDPNGGPHS